MPCTRPPQAALTRNNGRSKSEETRRVVECVGDGLNDHVIDGIEARGWPPIRVRSRASHPPAGRWTFATRTSGACRTARSWTTASWSDRRPAGCTGPGRTGAGHAEYSLNANLLQLGEAVLCNGSQSRLFHVLYTRQRSVQFHLD